MSADVAVSRYLRVGSTTLSRDDGSVSYRIAWSTRSGKAVPVTTTVAADLEAGRVPDADPRTLAALEVAEMIVPATEVELDTITSRLRTGAGDESYREFTLVPTAACNMGCTYCGQAHTRGDIGAHVRSSMQQRILAAIENPSVSKVSVRWFGGEPLLAYRHLLRMGAEHIEAVTESKVRYDARIVTNGALLTIDKARKLHSIAGIDLINITLDGPAEIHDASRITNSGRPTFDKITETISLCLRDETLSNLRFLLRTNVTTLNAPHIPEYLRRCKALGFDDPRVTFELAPVHSWGNDADSLGHDPVEFAELEAQWLQLMSELGLRFAFVPGAPKAVTCIALKPAAEVLSATGGVFSCTEKPLVPEAEEKEAITHLNLLSRDKLRPLGPYDDWIDGIDRGETPCRTCVMLGICGGSCPKLWRDGSTPCPSYKFNWNTRLTLLALKAGYRLTDDSGPVHV